MRLKISLIIQFAFIIFLSCNKDSQPTVSAPVVEDNEEVEYVQVGFIVPHDLAVSYRGIIVTPDADTVSWDTLIFELNEQNIYGMSDFNVETHSMHNCKAFSGEGFMAWDFNKISFYEPTFKLEDGYWRARFDVNIFEGDYPIVRMYWPSICYDECYRGECYLLWRVEYYLEVPAARIDSIDALTSNSLQQDHLAGFEEILGPKLIIIDTAGQ